MARMFSSPRRTLRRSIRTSTLLGSVLIGTALLPCSLGAFAYAAPKNSAQVQGIPALPEYDAQRAEVIKSPNDPAQYRALTLANGLQVLLVHDDRADKASASMDVNVGSAAEPADMPGLAHFLEHMLFLGTKRFPKAGEYQQYITEHGGSHNAFTSLRNTNYFFDITPGAFQGALDRFSQFFIAPQFNEDHVNRERHAVHAEYQARLQDDNRRVDDAMNQVLNPDHPFHKFSVGNLDTLTDGKGGKLRDRLIAFYQSHYDANVMKLVVMGPQPLDELEQWVRHAFSDIPNRHLSSTSIDVEQAHADQLPATLDIKSLADERSVTFMFPVEDPYRYSREKPDYLIGALLGDEGPHSLLAQLREKGWAQKLSAGGMNGDGKRALMGVSIELTPEGSRHIDDIQASLFAYVQQLKDSVEAWRFDEQSLLLRQQFRFQQTDASPSRATGLSMTLNHYPISEVSVMPYRMDRFDAGLIKRYLDALTPDRLLRVYTAPDVKGDRTSPYYQAPYRYQKVTHWPNATPLDAIEAPRSNPYIAKDFTLLPLKEHTPYALVQHDGMDIWYAPDNQFGTPSAFWDISLISPLPEQSVRTQLLTDLLANWLNDSLSETLYPAILAGQSGHARSHSRGIAINLSGWRDQQQGVMQTLLDQLLKGDMTQGSFDRIKLRLQEGYRNDRQRPLYQQMLSLPNNQLFKPYWSLKAQRDVLETLTLDDLKQFRTAFLKQVHVQGLVVGNVDAQSVRQQAQMLEARIAPNLKLNDVPRPTPLGIKGPLPTVRPETERHDAGALRYVQGRNQSLGQQARFAVLAQLIESPFFDQLRTREQLGYIVVARYMPMLEAPGIAFLIQSPNKDSNTLFARMDAWQTSFDEVMRTLDEKTLSNYKAAVLASVLERDQSLDMRAGRYWRELTLDYTRFDRRQRMAKAIEALTVADLQRTWQYVRQAPTFNVAADPNVPATDIDAGEQLTPLPYN